MTTNAPTSAAANTASGMDCLEASDEEAAALEVSFDLVGAASRTSSAAG